MLLQRPSPISAALANDDPPVIVSARPETSGLGDLRARCRRR
ncbi:MAG: hypothetical protein WKF83_12140 [Nocardioidaceae bacterium]